MKVADEVVDDDDEDGSTEGPPLVPDAPDGVSDGGRGAPGL